MRKRAPSVAEPFVDRARRIAVDVLSSHLGLAIAAIAIYALVGQFSERIDTNFGLGDDGKKYGAWAADAWTTLKSKELDSYQLQRALPPALVWAIHKALKVAPTDRAIIRTFLVINVALVGISAATYSRIVRILGASERARMFGGLTIFGAYSILKWSHYSPVLVDLWAFAIGGVFLLLHLERRAVLLAFATLIAAFCWPSALEIGCVLLVCLRFDELDVDPRPSPARLSLVVAGACTLAYSLYGRHLLATTYTLDGAAKPEDWFVRGSLAIGALFIFFGAYRLLDDARLYSPGRWLRSLFRWDLWIALGLFFSVRWLRRWASNGSMGALDTRDFLDVTVYTSVARPGVFMLAHALFFGPLVLMLFLRWSSIARRLRESGVGLTLVALLGIALALNSESRRLFLLAGLFLPFVVVELDELEWRARDWAVVSALTLVSSKLWLTIDTTLGGSALDWPAQSLFMTSGPWMSWTSYLWQGAIVAACLPYLFVLSRGSVSTRASLPRGPLHSPPTSSRGS